MSLEQRLRAELDRAAPTALPPAPALAELHETVSGRRRRNRWLASVAAAVVAVGVAGGLLANRAEPSSDVIAAAPGSAESSSADTGVTVDQGAPAIVEETAESDGAGDQLSDEDVTSAIEAEEGITTLLRAATTPVTLETRASAVEFAGGSGVFVVATEDGYGGIAGRFGGAEGVTAIGLQSENGLDWVEVALSGVPAGASATHLREFDGTYVALFSQFDSANQRNVVTLSTSTDLETWTSGAALAGDDVVVSDFAVGPAGVVMVGTGRAPAVWAGPATGPFVQVGSIDTAATVAGVVAIDDGFVAAGTADGQPMLFETSDGAMWNPVAMSGLADDDAVVEVAVADGVILIAGGGERAWTASSADGGQTWSRSELDRSLVDTVAMRGRSVSFLGSSSLGAPTVTLTDGTTWSSAELDVVGGDRVELLIAGERTVLLAAGEDGLTWMVASR